MSTRLVLLRVLQTGDDKEALTLGELRDDAWSSSGDRLVATGERTLALADATAAGAELLARVQCRGTTGPAAALAVVPAAPGLAVEGQALWGLRVLRPGQILTLTVGDFLLSRRYQAVRHDAPAALADRSCPVCGIELGAAPVAACRCGMRYHAEEGSKADSLSCYSESPLCIKCREPKHFEAVWLPAPEALRLGGHS